MKTVDSLMQQDAVHRAVATARGLLYGETGMFEKCADHEYA